MNNVSRSDALLTITQLLLRIGMVLLALGIALAGGAVIALIVVPWLCATRVLWLLVGRSAHPSGD